MTYCKACDSKITGTVYTFGEHSPLCRKCCFELEALHLKDEEKGKDELRELSLVARFFLGLFGGGK